MKKAVRRIGLAASVFAALGALLLVAQVLTAGWIFDHYADTALRRVQQRIPGLQLSRVEGDSSLTSRQGRIDWQIQLPGGNALGLADLSGSTAYEINFGLLQASASFAHVPGSGNLSELFARLKVSPVNYQGALRVKALMPELSLSVRTSPFTLPLQYGSCASGANSLYVKATGPEDIEAAADVSELKCRGNEIYAGRESFNADITALSVTAQPRFDMETNKLYGDGLTFKADSLVLDFSTLFALGFDPDAKVKDPTLRDRVSASGLHAAISFKDADSSGKGYINMVGGGNLAWAFPAVAYGKEQSEFRLDNINIDARAGRVNLKGMFKALGKLDGEDGLQGLTACLGQQQEFYLPHFSLMYSGQETEISGEASASADLSAFKVSGMLADFKLQGGSALVAALAGEEYMPALRDLVRQGLVTFDGQTYRTDLAFQGTLLTLNGRPLALKSADDDLPTEE